MQLVVVNVTQSQDQGLKYIEVKAVISSISRAGLVSIDFNQRLKPIVPAAVDPSALQILITANKKSEVADPQLNYSWNALEFIED